MQGKHKMPITPILLPQLGMQMKTNVEYQTYIICIFLPTSYPKPVTPDHLVNL